VTEWPGINTHGNYCDMLLTLGACDSRACTETGGKRWLTLVDVIQTPMRFEDWSSVSLRYEVQHARRLWIHVVCGLANTNRWMCHNCSCGKRAVAKLARHWKIIVPVPAEGPQSNSWQLIGIILLIEEHTFVARRSFFHAHFTSKYEAHIFGSFYTLSHLMVTYMSKAKCFRTCIMIFWLIFLRQNYNLESWCADMFLPRIYIYIYIYIYFNYLKLKLMLRKSPI
jgi:uncharacterized membrane protein